MSQEDVNTLNGGRRRWKRKRKTILLSDGTMKEAAG
jgi:hypothetical protein